MKIFIFINYIYDKSIRGLSSHNVEPQINTIIGGAPENLNTLGKLAQSIGNNSQINTSLQNEKKNKI